MLACNVQDDICLSQIHILNLPCHFRLCRESNGVDFDDLLGLTVALLQGVPQVREQLQQRWRHVLVDEFQAGAPSRIGRDGAERTTD
jgi:hypothetical protein